MYLNHSATVVAIYFSGNFINSKYTPYNSGKKASDCPKTQTNGLCGESIYFCNCLCWMVTGRNHRSWKGTVVGGDDPCNTTPNSVSAADEPEGLNMGKLFYHNGPMSNSHKTVFMGSHHQQLQRERQPIGALEASRYGVGQLHRKFLRPPTTYWLRQWPVIHLPISRPCLFRPASRYASTKLRKRISTWVQMMEDLSLWKKVNQIWTKKLSFTNPLVPPHSIHLLSPMASQINWLFSMLWGTGPLLLPMPSAPTACQRAISSGYCKRAVI